MNWAMLRWVGTQDSALSGLMRTVQFIAFHGGVGQERGAVGRVDPFGGGGYLPDRIAATDAARPKVSILPARRAMPTFP